MPTRLFGFMKRGKNKAATPPPPPPAAAYQAPTNAATALAIAEDVRNARLTAQNGNLELAGTLEARLAAVVTDMNADRYTSARTALVQLNQDLDAEAQALATAQQKYNTDKSALESGDLAKVPATAPGGLGAAHAAVGSAKAALPGAPRTLADYNAALTALATLQNRTREYLAAESQALASGKKAYADGKAALEAGDLANVPDQARAGLAAEHAAVGLAKAALPADPQTIDDCVAAQQLLADLQGKVKRYLDAEVAALAAARKDYDDKKLALDNGDLKRLPAKAPPGLDAAHGAVGTSRSALPTDPKGFDEIAAANVALDELRSVLQKYLDAEALVIAAAKKTYADGKAKLESGDLTKLPAKAPKGLEVAYAAVTDGRAALPADPPTWDACEKAQARLAQLEKDLAAYLDAEAKALDATKKKYDADKLALENGDLKKLPAAAPTGLAAQHGAVGTAKAALIADPKTLLEYQDAAERLEALRQKVAEYLDAETKALAAAKKTYEDDKAALDSGDLAKVPASAPTGLESLHAAVGTAKSALPADPKTIDEYLAASQKLAELKTKVGEYLKGAAKKKNVDEGLAKYSSTGSKLSELTGHADLNTRQKTLLDEALKKKLAESDTELTATELKQKAQEIVDKTNKLAETPLEATFPQINATLAKSPKLKDNIVQLQHDGWTIVANTPGAGSSCDKRNKKIVIDPDDPLDEALGGLAHETGHALFTPPTKPTVAATASGKDYVKKCVESCFIDEGEAQMVACRTVKELQAAGKTASVPADTGQFMPVYEQFESGTITEDAARKQMAQSFGGLITSTTGESYLNYYGNHYINVWNAAQTDASKRLTTADLGTITLFA